MFWRKKQKKAEEKHRKRRKRRRSEKGGVEQTLENFVVEEIEIGAVPSVEPEVDTRRLSRRRRRKSLSGVRFAFGWIGLWLLIVAAGMVTRSIWPPDETRLLALAWDMWHRGEWLTPQLNGEPWFGQGPITLWLVLSGWQFLGLNDWWPRLLPAVAGLFVLFLTTAFAHKLWPDQKEVVRYVPVLLLGTVLWAMYQTLALDHLLLVSMTLLTMMAVHGYASGGRGAALVIGLLIGMSLLVGGPVALVYVVPAMLLAPMWSGRDGKAGWGGWYGAALLAIIIGTGLWLAWLIPASRSAGLDWQQAIAAASSLQPLDLFYRQGSWWWYLYLIPLAFFPWSVWPLGWIRLWQVRGQKLDSGFTLCMIWGISAIVILTLLPVRQPQFLLPLFPAYVLVFAWLLMHEDLRTVGEDSFFAGMTFPVIAIGGALAVLPGMPRVDFLPAILWSISPMIGVVVAALGIVLSWMPTMNTGKRVMSIAVTTMFVVVASSFFAGYQWGDRYQVDSLNKLLYETENEGRAIAQVAPYQGEFHFSSRLTQPIAVLTRDQTRDWILSNPTGVMLTYDTGWQPNAISASAQLLEIPYGDTNLRVWDAGLLIPSP